MKNKPINVLLVEDNSGDVRLIREMLADKEAALFAVTCAGRLSTGLEHLSEETPDVVLLDLSLPDSKRLDTFVRMQRHAPQVPVVVLTGLDDEEMGIQAVWEGAQDYLVKGEVDGHLLVRSVRYAIARKRCEEALRESARRLASVETLRQTLVTLSHYINNAINAITGNAELCQLGEVSTDQLTEVCFCEAKRISAVIAALGRMVEKMDLRTADYVGLQDAVFDIEEELNHALEEDSVDLPRQRPEEGHSVLGEYSFRAARKT